MIGLWRRLALALALQATVGCGLVGGPQPEPPAVQAGPDERDGGKDGMSSGFAPPCDPDAGAADASMPSNAGPDAAICP